MSRGDGIDVKDENVKSFLKEKLVDGEYFIGIREGYLNLYYEGASAAKIEFYKKGSIKSFYDVPKGKNACFPTKFEKDEASFEIHEEYVNDEEPCKKKRTESGKYITVHFNYYRRMFSDVIKNIEKNHELSSDEKIVQQKIINCANANKSSDWYYVDMEYIKPNEPTGRFDMIAISRKKHNDKHIVALVELKVGSGSYKGIGKRYYDEKYRDKYPAIKRDEKCFYDKAASGPDAYLSFGSGVVGHITNFMRFLAFDKYNELLKKDIVSILAKKKAMGILEDLSLADIEDKDLADIPELYLVSYTHNPDKAKEESISDLKQEMAKYIFSEFASVPRCSEHSLENLIHKNHIKGIVNDKDMIRFLSEDMDKESTIQKHTCKLDINEQSYNLHFVFADSGEKEDDWNWDFL